MCDATDQAAYNKLKAAMQAHIASNINRESGGWNYTTASGASGSTPTRHGAVCPPSGGACLGPSIGGDSSLIPPGATNITMWHTHGLNSASTIFSYWDYILMQGSHPNNPLNSSQRANLTGGYYMDSNFTMHVYMSGDLPNYTVNDTNGQNQVAQNTQGASKQVIGCK